MTINDLQVTYKLTKEDFWEIRPNSKKYAITHDACEKIASIENIQFFKPDVHLTKYGIALLGEAKKGDVKIWATGESSPDNVKMHGKYYWSMAEKRLKDRLILKLINAYEYGIYSESESDEFKKGEK